MKNKPLIIKKYFLSITKFGYANILTLVDKIVEETIQIKQTKKIKLPDAIIAATALHHNMELITNNSKDFKGINLIVHEPIMLDGVAKPVQ